MLRRAVLIHKTPPSWSKIREFQDSAALSVEDLETLLGQLPPSSVPQDIIETDIYAALVQEIARILDFDEVCIVQGFDPAEKRNWQASEQAGCARLDARTRFISIHHPSHLRAFANLDLVFTRGRYPALHHTFAKQRQKSTGVWLHYPATSLHYPHFDRCLNAWRAQLDGDWRRAKESLVEILKRWQAENDLRLKEFMDNGVFDPGRLLQTAHDVEAVFRTLNQLPLRNRPAQPDCPYDIVLCDDTDSTAELERMYPGSSVRTFTKPALTPLVEAGPERTWDLAFCGTSLQATKNHLLFAGLLPYLDTLSAVPLRIAVLGNQGNLASYNDALAADYAKLVIDDLGELSRTQTLDVFNRSRALLITSGRDSNPRVIAEAAVHGARTVALDLLSDGLNVLSANPELGGVISTEPCAWLYTSGGNLEIAPGAEIAQAILGELARSNAPLATAARANEVFNLPSCARAVCDMVKEVTAQQKDSAHSH